MHVLPNSTEHPVVYASQMLKPSDNNYAQLEKKALSLIYGIRKFHKYIYGCGFTLVTDHWTLTTILGPTTGIPSTHLQCWALLISGYNHTIQFYATQCTPIQMNCHGYQCHASCHWTGETNTREYLHSVTVAATSSVSGPAEESYTH